MSTTQFTAPPGVPELHISHRFDALRELMWKAWTQPEHAIHC